MYPSCSKAVKDSGTTMVIIRLSCRGIGSVVGVVTNERYVPHVAVSNWLKVLQKVMSGKASLNDLVERFSNAMQ